MTEDRPESDIDEWPKCCLLIDFARQHISNSAHQGHFARGVVLDVVNGVADGPCMFLTK